MAGIDAIRSDVEAVSGAPVEGDGSSAMVCGATSEELRLEIDLLLAKVSTTDKIKIVTDEEMDGGFVLARSNGGPVHRKEVDGIGRALGSKFQLEIAKMSGNRVYIVKPPNVSPNSGGTDKRAERDRERAAQHLVRTTDPKLRGVG